VLSDGAPASNCGFELDHAAFAGMALAVSLSLLSSKKLLTATSSVKDEPTQDHKDEYQQSDYSAAIRSRDSELKH
jgi:hypothetical protein